MDKSLWGGYIKRCSYIFKNVFYNRRICSKRNENVQFLRGIAMLAIVLYHFQMFYPVDKMKWIQSVFLFGSGNEIFFVITGYFIGKEMNKEWDITEATVFIIKKLKRLSKPLIIWGAVAAFVYAREPYISNCDAVQWYLATVTYMQNFYNSIHPNAFGYTWFIACEVQFFIIFSVILFSKKFKWFLFGVGVFLLSFSNPLPNNVRWMFYYQAIIIGVFMWKIINESKAIEILVNSLSMFYRRLVFCVLLLAGGAIQLRVGGDYSITLSAVLYSVPFMIAILSKDFIFPRALDIIKSIGDCSYSMYLIHIPIIIFMNQLCVNTYLWEMKCIYFFMVLILIYFSSVLSKKYIE